MPEKSTAENLFNNLVETIAESAGKHNAVSFLRKRKQTQSPPSSFGCLAARSLRATAVWVLFEWLNYHLLSFIFFALVLGLLAQFVLKNASGLLNRSPSKVPRLVLPDDLFVNIAVAIGSELSRALGYLQDIACGGNLKQLLVVIGSLWAAAMIGSWCNFLTVLYVGFVAAHIAVLYEEYEDQIDSFVYKVLDHLQHNYKKLDAGVLSRIPKGKKVE
ncbi:hypothetical protein FNV43_RR13265 [Rhamnella rubrinervis]|uniref:Reticulon-like protein n=1 Tax=Rhamnella rubrinervis TaxID=2594499 RepID=A0A8K0H0X2_9ROSA|nr:hypothetical protein FNV43_RR13265 [Rhamnella rubrinervis]